MIHCPQCGASVADVEGPTHAYYGEAPGCWALFGEVIARTLSDDRFAPLHQLTADTYAAQHPGSAADRRAVQSVAVHLIGLCVSLERPAALAPTRALAPLLQAAADRSDRFHWLQPPAHLGEVTVVEVHRALSVPTRARHDDDTARQFAAVRRWAESVWSAWAVHHDVVRRWATSLVEDPVGGAQRRRRR